MLKRDQTAQADQAFLALLISLVLQVLRAFLVHQLHQAFLVNQASLVFQAPRVSKKAHQALQTYHQLQNLQTHPQLQNLQTCLPLEFHPQNQVIQEIPVQTKHHQLLYPHLPINVLHPADLQELRLHYVSHLITQQDHATLMENAMAEEKIVLPVPVIADALIKSVEMAYVLLEKIV